jgi:TonB family protein
MRKVRLVLSAIGLLLFIATIGYFIVRKPTPRPQATKENGCVASDENQKLPVEETWTGNGTERDSWDSEHPPAHKSKSRTETRTFVIKAAGPVGTTISIKPSRLTPGAGLRFDQLPSMGLELKEGGTYSSHTVSTGGQPLGEFEQGAERLRGRTPPNLSDDVEADTTLTINGDAGDSATLVYSRRSFRHSTRRLAYEFEASYSLRKTSETGTPRDKHIRVSAELQATKLINSPQPVYPVLARQAGIQGAVKLRAAISKEGSVEAIEVIAGHPLLVPAAVEAVRCWVYRPTVTNGEHVGVYTDIDVKFSLNR